MATKRVGKYEVGQTIGEGTFGRVKYAVNTETGEAVAIKVLDKERIQQQQMGQQIKKEIQIMKMIRHRYVVQLREVLASKTKIFIVLELVTGGELFDKLVTEGRFTEARARFYFQQLIEGVEYCHSQGVCHRDLKPENLLLDEGMNLKISDFGLSALYTGSSGEGASRTTLLHTTCGTPNYVAPEVLADKGYDGRTADVWSCGVILYVLLAAFLPFDEPTLVALFGRIQRAEFSYPSWFTPEARALLDAILVADPAQRATIPQIKQHPWFAGRAAAEEEPAAEAEGEDGHRHHCHREHCCPLSPPPPPPTDTDNDNDEDTATTNNSPPPPPPPPYLATTDSWRALNSQPGASTTSTRPAGSRRLLQFAVAGRKDVRAIVQGVMVALKEDMEMEVRAKEAGKGVHKIKATRLTPKGLLGVLIEVHDPYAATPSSSPSPSSSSSEGEHHHEGEEERAYQRRITTTTTTTTMAAGAEKAAGTGDDDGDEDEDHHAGEGAKRLVLVEIRRGKGDILAFRQWYHDFVRYHLPPLLPPLLHASATTSLVGAGEPGGGNVGIGGPQRLPSFGSVPGAK